jgi:hypothetical protein
MRRRAARVRAGIVALAIVGMAALLGAWLSAASATLSPPSATLTVAAGASATESKTVDVPAAPPIADIEIAIDTTGSMGPSIAQAKADATALVTAVQAAVPGAQFAIVEFKDQGDTPEYRVAQAVTGDATAVQAAVNGLSALGGNDLPEAYNLVFRNSHTPAVGGDLGWRAGSRKFVVVIGDAEPHGAGTAGIPGCSDTSGDPNSLNTASELAAMAAAQRTLFMIRQVGGGGSTSLACYQGLAAGAFAGGQGVDAGTSLAGQIVALISGATGTVTDVHLAVASASPAPADPSWISFTPAAAGPVTPPASLAFTLTATVPAGTPAGTYAFDIVALADGADIGHQALTVVVPGGPPNRPPDCSKLTVEKASHKASKHPLVAVTVRGARDPDGDAVTTVVTGVTQDEPVSGPPHKKGPTAPDAALTSPPSARALVRAERDPKGDGRVYRLAVSVTDPAGATCTGVVKVGVPNGKKGTPAVDSAPPGFDSLVP